MFSTTTPSCRVVSIWTVVLEGVQTDEVLRDEIDHVKLLKCMYLCMEINIKLDTGQNS